MGGICKPSVTETTSRVVIPDYLENYEEQAVNRLLESSDIGRAIAGFSIDPNTGELVTPERAQYTGDRVQPFTSDQLSAFDAIRENAGFGSAPARGSEALSDAYKFVDSGAKSWSDAGGENFLPTPVTASTVGKAGFTDVGADGTSNASKYMNPYMDEVAEAVMRDLDRREATRTTQDDAALADQGALGNTRAGVVAGDRARDFDMTRVDALSGLYGTAYDKAGNLFAADADRDVKVDTQNQVAGLNAQEFNETFGLDAHAANTRQFNTDQDRILSAAPLLTDMGVAEQSMAGRAAESMLDIGNMGQLQGQVGLDTAYGDFTDQQNFPYEQFGFLQGTFTGQPAQKAPYTQTGQQLGPSPFQQIAGGIATGIGAYKTFCWVAREAYGEDDPRWLAFREWMLTDAPAPLRAHYAEHGPDMAAAIADKPELKALIAGLMDAVLDGRKERAHAAAA